MIDIKDIVFIKNINFKDNRKNDLKINGHPCLIIHITEDFIYFLKISNHPPKNETKKEQFYLPHIGFINIKDIYKKERKEYNLYSFLSDELYEDVMEEFNFYQINIKEDEYYHELFEENLTLKLNKK